MFRLLFNPGDRYLLDAEKWVEFAVVRGVKELDIDFCQTIYDPEAFQPIERSRLCNLPNSFCCDSITHLSLSRLDFCPPSNFKGCTYLKVLHLCDVGVTDALLESMLSNCLLLEELSLRDCYALTRVKASAPDLPLKSLTVVDCWDAYEIEIFAPNLQSFHFYGPLIHMSFENISSLVDVLVNGLDREGYEPDHDWIPILRHLEHVKFLTLCNFSLLYVVITEECSPEDLPVTFHNLQELQLLMDWTLGCYLANTYSFFKNCPCPSLEKLFIELPSAAKDRSQRDQQFERLPEEDPPEIVFDHLKAIKMNGFRGLKKEMLLVKFFLERSSVLESLVLVAPQKCVGNKKDSAKECKSINAPLGLLREQILILAKASSSNPQISICEYSDDDCALIPTHTEVYCKG